MTTNQELFDRAQITTPGGVNSPVRAFRSVGGVPRFIKRAQGAYFWDVEDKKYIDCIGSWGPMILGHAHPDVVKAVQRAAENSFSYGAPTEAEILMAEKIVELVPSIEQVRLWYSNDICGTTRERSRSGLVAVACQHILGDCL